MPPRVRLKGAFFLHEGRYRLAGGSVDAGGQAGEHGGTGGAGFGEAGAGEGQVEDDGFDLQPGVGARAAAGRDALGEVDAQAAQGVHAVDEVERGAFHDGFEDFAACGAGMQAEDDACSIRQVVWPLRRVEMREHQQRGRIVDRSDA